MPKRLDLDKILIIGSGPIVIGQACEFDYSGSQACKALKKLGYTIVLVNSNPATIMTDPQTADITYIEPLNIERLTAIIEKERPDALLPNLGGQSGLNLCSELAKAGVLEKYGVEVIGVKVESIDKGEDRISFKKAMEEIGVEMAASKPAYSVEQAEEIALEMGFPVVVRPAYTMGGAGSGLVYNIDELHNIVRRGLSASIIGQVLIEESVLGWEELELEVVRDAKGQMITVCFIENIDPMGVHTGDSLCAAPMLTISKETQQKLQKAAYKIVDSIGVIGGTNVQFAHHPQTGRFVVIEINPRTSRSSALASKATGFPIASVSTMLAAGLTLDEIPCGKYGSLDKYSPDGDYVVIKMARWAFEKFKNAEDKLGTQMKAVGEVMSIGKTYKEALQKAVRSLENGNYGFGFVKNLHEKSLEELLSLLHTPSSMRHFQLYEALRKGANPQQLHEITAIKLYFLEQMQELVQLEEEIITAGKALSPELLRRAKIDGFADRYLAKLTGLSESKIRTMRAAEGLVEQWETIHVSGTENAAYFYSSYQATNPAAPHTGNNKIMILGSGPNRIGQGIEFDYCCVHASMALKELGFESIIVNCNPETVSTDYDTSDRLYFEPLTAEDVLAIFEAEKPLGAIAQFGGQTPLNLARELEANGVKILGTSPETIDLAEDRDRFNKIMEELQIPMPPSGMAVTADDAIAIADRIGYPLIVRPSYVLGGRGMEIVYDEESLASYMEAAIGVTPDRPILVDRFLDNALECEADAVSDDTGVFVPAIMEHIELAGIHSGDSACVIPSIQICDEHKAQIEDYTKRIASSMGVRGLMNMQYAISDGIVYVLEANPRASRTVPLVSKVCDIQMVHLATEIITREFTLKPSPVPQLKQRSFSHYGVKEAVFPFNMLPDVDPLLGPEMRSTGEVLGLASTFGEAYYKAQEGAGNVLPLSGTVFISVSDRNKNEVAEVARGFADCGIKIIATGGTHKLLIHNNIPSTKIAKISEGRPNILDAITNGEVQLVVNTPSGGKSTGESSDVRKAAIRYKLSYITTMATARACIKSIKQALYSKSPEPQSLQEYHKKIK
ncbi:MAG: carbamoyl-phosphate synthase large subunit [Clostridia bacterium]|nr:carbamoyl-phosphate synthase large subunit [Clostridia bacterium]MDD4798241.1 carbamoyl-phosphate synthase large subunit [Clostridia bacterium]